MNSLIVFKIFSRLRETPLYLLFLICSFLIVFNSHWRTRCHVPHGGRCPGRATITPRLVELWSWTLRSEGWRGGVSEPKPSIYKVRCSTQVFFMLKLKDLELKYKVQGWTIVKSQERGNGSKHNLRYSNTTLQRVLVRQSQEWLWPTLRVREETGDCSSSTYNGDTERVIKRLK